MLPWNEDFLEPYLPEHARTAIVVGAHEGIWVRKMAALFEKVIAIEASPESAARLKATMPQNVETIEAAAWITGGHTLPFHVRAANQMASALACRDLLRNHEVTQTIWVPTLAIDDLNLQNVDMILVDVEGAELEAMKGATQTIERWRPDLIIECHERENRLWLSDWLERCGYNLCHLHEPNRELFDEWGRHVYLIGHHYRPRD